MAEDKALLILEEFGESVINSARTVLTDLIRYRGGTQVDLTSDKNMRFEILKTAQGYTFRFYMADYWKYIEKGRRAGAKQPPTRVLGGDWQNKHFSPSDLLLKITNNALAKKGIKRKAKRLPFDKAQRQLSFIFARSIAKKGIKPRPFINKIFSKRLLSDLGTKMRAAIKEDFIIAIAVEQ